jgi:hypothetical protein
MADNPLKSNKQLHDVTNDSDEKKSSDDGVKEDLVAQVEDLSQQLQGLSEAIDAGVATFGLSEIGRILLRIVCNIVPPLEKIGKLNPKLEFYFKKISLKKIIDLVQLLEFVLLVIIWGVVILVFLTLIAMISYCLSGVGEALECASEITSVII